MNIVFFYFFISGLLAFFTTFYLFYKYKADNNIWMLLFLLAAGIYSFGYSMELLSNGFTLSLFWLKFEYIGLSFYSSLIFLSALDYKNRNKNIFLKFFLLLVSGSFLVIFLYNHNLLFENLEFKKTPFASISIFKSTLLYKLENIFDVILGIIAILIFAKYIFQSIKEQKKYFIFITSLIAIVIFFCIINIIIDDSISFYFVSILDTLPIYIWFYILVIKRLSTLETLFHDKVFESSPMEIIVLDKNYFIIDENNAAKDSFSINFKKNISHVSPEIFRCLNRSINRIKSLKINENFYNISISEYRKKNKIIGYILNFNNISELKEAETSLEKVNQELLDLNKEREELILTISHDLRTPLNGIKGLTQLALINKNYNLEYLHNINSSSEHMLNLLNKILLSKKEDSLIKFSFDSLFKEISLMFMKICSDKKIFLITDISKNTPSIIIGDINKIRQILFNIVENAIKYTKNGGVLLKMKSTEISTNKSNIFITVEDSGIGIEDVSKVFDKFYKEDSFVETSSYGIGLFNTKKLVESLDGSIKIKSPPNMGTRVEINLTLEITKQHRVSEMKKINKSCIIISNSKLINKFFSSIFEEYEIEFSIFKTFEEFEEIKSELGNNNTIFSVEYNKNYVENKNYIFLDYEVKENISNFISLLSLSRNKILKFLDIENIFEETSDTRINIPNYDGVKALILEDNELNLYYLEEIFKLMNVEFDSTKDVADTKIFMENKNYDIIFSDINLGEATSFDFIETLKKSSDIIKIAITASVTENIRKHCFDRGFDEFIGKPYKIEEIIDIFNKYFFKTNIKYERKVTRLENLKEYYDIFFDGIKDEISNLSKAINELEWSAINTISHKLKSGAYIIKETQLIEILINIENYSQKNDKLQLEREFLNLKNILNVIEEKVKNENSNSRR